MIIQTFYRFSLLLMAAAQTTWDACGSGKK